MNVKKYLKTQAEQDRKEILASDDGEFLHALQQMVEEKPKKHPPLRVWLPSTLSAVAAAAVLVTCIAVYYPFGSEHVEYLDINLVHSDSTLTELNQDVKEVDLQIDDSLYSYSVKKTSDSVSGDVLYYLTRIENPAEFVQLEIVTVCNPNYKYKNFSFTQEPQSIALSNYTVMYRTFTTMNAEFGIETLNAQASIHKGKEVIYVTNYSELLLNPDGSFLEILQSIVK